MGFLDFLRAVASGQTPVGGPVAPAVQRVAQQAVDAQHPTFMGHDVSGVPVLSGVIRPAVEALNAAGVINEGATNVAKTAMGASTAELGLLHALLNGPAGGVVNAVAQTTPLAPVVNALQLMDHVGPHLGAANPLPALQAALGAAQQPGNPFERAQAASAAAQSTSPVQAGIGEMAINPLNLAGPAGEAGAGLRAVEDAPTLLRALGTALEGASAVGRAGVLPYEGAFAALGGGLRKILPSAADAGAQFAQDNAGNTALTGTKGNVAYADLLKAIGQNGKPGLGPELPPLADVPLPPEVGPALPTRGNLPGDQLIPGIGRNGGKGIGPLLPALQDVPAPPTPPAVQPLADLLNAGRQTARPTPLKQLLGAAQDVAGREVRPRQSVSQIEAAIPKLPETPETGQLPLPEAGPSTPVTPAAAAPDLLPLDFTDRAGTIKAVANAPVSHLNAVLADLHNAIYPGQSADFAIPALTGQARQDFRTSFLTDHPSGNAAEPYLDYLLSRVQKDPKAAARLADLNPQLADDITLLTESDLPLAEHKRLVQSLFGAGPFAGEEAPADALSSLSGQPGAQAGTLDDLRQLMLTGDGGKGMRYPPRDPAFYAKRLGIPEDQVPGMLEQLVQDGTLGRLPDGSLGIKPATPAALPNVDIPATPVDDWRASAGPDAQDLLSGIEDAVKRGNVDEANYLVATAADYGVPVSRAQAVLNAAADAGGKDAGVEAQRATIEGSPYFSVFKYFNRDGTLKKVNPTTGAKLVLRDNGKIVRGADEVWNLPGSGYDEVAADALASPEFQNNQNFGQTSDDFWRNAQQAFRQYQGLKKPGATFGGDLAAGGGGFGLVPLSTGRVAGGLAGSLVGGGAGFLAPADDTETRLRRAGTGALLGGTLGTGIGSTPQGEALAEEALAGQGAAWRAGSKDIRPTSIGNAVSVIRAPQKTALMTIPRNIMDNAIKQALGGNSPVKYLGDLLAQSREWGTLLPDLRNAGDEQQRMHLMLSSLGPDFANRDPESMARLAVKQGMDYNLDPEDLGTAGAHPLVSAGRGAVGALTQPTKLLATGFLTPAVGALEGATLAGRAALQSAVLTPADLIGRFAFSMPEYSRQLADAAPAFIKKVAATGQSTALLDQEGRFGASLIKDPALRAEWEATQQAAEDAGASVALDHMGDFATDTPVRRIVNNTFPGGVWNIGQAQLLARRAAEHPQLALGAIRAAQESYRAALAAGHPEDAGTATIDQDTPGLGLVARLANGGAAGPLHIPLTYSGSPIGPEILDVPRQLDPYLHPNQQLYDKIKTLTGALGLGVNPALDMAAYRLGISDTPHAAASRWAPIGTYAEQMAHAAGVPVLGALAENPVADLLSPDAKPGDVQQQLRTGRYLDPAAITAGNELIYERRGTSASDPKNADLVAQLRDPTSDFYQEALARGLGARAGQSLLNEVIPGHPQAQTATAYAAEGARTALLNQGLPLTQAQKQAIAADPNGGQLLSQLLTQRLDQAKLDNPVLAVQDAGTPQALGQKVFDQWQRDHAGLMLFPSVYNVQAAMEQERLGLVPLGTAAAAQQHFDQLAAGQIFGRPETYPGMAPMPYDPTPIFDLMRYLNGGR